MTYYATITSKRQITIPAKLFKKVNFKKGQKVVFSIENGKIHLETATDQVNRLAGSLSLPKKFKNTNLDELILQAKKEYFANKKL